MGEIKDKARSEAKLEKMRIKQEQNESEWKCPVKSKEAPLTPDSHLLMIRSENGTTCGTSSPRCCSEEEVFDSSRSSSSSSCANDKAGSSRTSGGTRYGYRGRILLSCPRSLCCRSTEVGKANSKQEGKVKSRRTSRQGRESAKSRRGVSAGVSCSSCILGFAARSR